MLKVTDALKAHLVEHNGLPADSDEENTRKAAAEAIVSGDLTTDQLTELTKDPDADSGNELLKALQAQTEAIKAIGDRVTRIEETASHVEYVNEPSDSTKGSDAQLKNAPAKIGSDGEALKKHQPSILDKALAGRAMESQESPGFIRQIGAEERYQKTRTELRFPEKAAGPGGPGTGMPHPLAGRRLYEGGDGVNCTKRYIDEPSELDLAIGGAWVKYSLWAERGCSNHGLPRGLQVNDHDLGLVNYALHNCKWGGVIHGEYEDTPGSIGVKDRKLTPSEIKAILDDTTSGGLEIAPIVFDDQIIFTPLLHGEFFPLVNTQNITRGRRMEGASMGNVTLQSGGADGTNIDLFNTASFIAAFDTTIFAVDGSIELGLDFMSDTPIDVSAAISNSYGQQLLTWLDTQVCTGDGTTEPEGVTVASGTVSVSSANGAGGPWTIGDLEGLLFGVTKAYRAGFPTSRITYGSNETTYQRVRGIAVGGADQRRVLGMDHESYSALGHPYGISGSFTNPQLVFVNWARYRMYRRLGLTISSTTEGRTLKRLNQMLIVARARYGGQIEDGSAVAIVTDGQS